MGIECLESLSPVNLWLHHIPAAMAQQRKALEDSSRALCSSSISISTPTNTTVIVNSPKTYFFSTSSEPDIGDTMAACRRASSFPLAHSTALPSSLKVRSQSESAGLNKINIKVPKNLFHELEMCRPKLHCAGTNASCCTPSGVSFYAPSPNEIQSDSEGDDSLVSSEESGNSSSSTECVHDDDDDLGVVCDLELFEQHNDRLFASNRKSASNLSLSAIPLPKVVELSSTPSSRFTFLASTDVVENKKGVRFADECGAPLETVRVMTEPSDYPPYVNPSVIWRYRKAAFAAMSVATSSILPSSSSSVIDDDDDDEIDVLKIPRSTWKITFKQPASEYVKFREVLDHQKLALENVMLKNDIAKMVGTIKVANIAFEKRVFLRFTSDGWKSYLDRPATYQSSPSKTYDTFRFDIDIPRDSDKNSRIEFCVCYIANSTDEYWDSNSGKNFVLTASAYEQPLLTPPSPTSPLRSTKTTSVLGSASLRDDAYCMDYKNWSKFASWRSLKTDIPYW